MPKAWKTPEHVEQRVLALLTYQELTQKQIVEQIKKEYGYKISIRTIYDIAKRNPVLPVTTNTLPPSQNCRVLVIPDTHHPFQHPDIIEFLQAVYKAGACDTVVHLGDEIDAHNFSRHMPDPDGMSPGHELSASIESLKPLYRAFPNVKVCESNHTVRPWKKGFEAGLPANFMPTYSQILNAPDGWKWADMWEIDGVLYFHGDKGKSGKYAHRNYIDAYHKSCVIGHIHAHAGVNWDGDLFGMNAGCLIDEKAYAFKYAKAYTGKVNLGCGLVFEGKEAYFIPMQTDTHGRWTGKLLA